MDGLTLYLIATLMEMTGAAGIAIINPDGSVAIIADPEKIPAIDDGAFAAAMRADMIAETAVFN